MLFNQHLKYVIFGTEEWYNTSICMYIWIQVEKSNYANMRKISSSPIEKQVKQHATAITAAATLIRRRNRAGRGWDNGEKIDAGDQLKLLGEFRRIGNRKAQTTSRTRTKTTRKRTTNKKSRRPRKTASDSKIECI